MGMAASQARFLGLTARQNNVEFEGQQINQQRTLLANQSANYYNDLLGMTVPTPPSVDNYTKTVYTFNDGALTNTVTAMIAQSNGYYTMSYLSKWQDDYAPISAATSVVNRKMSNAQYADIGTSGNYTYYVGATELRELASGIELIPPEPNTLTKDGKHIYKDLETGKLYTKSNECTENEIKNLEYYYFVPDVDIIEEEGKIPYFIDDENGEFHQAVFEARKEDGKYYYQDENNITQEITLDQLMMSLDTTNVQNKNDIRFVELDEQGNYIKEDDDAHKEFLSDDEIIELSKVDASKYPALEGMTEKEIKGLIKEESAWKVLLEQKYKVSDWLVRYQTDTKLGKVIPYFYSKASLDGAVYDDRGYTLGKIDCYTIGSEQRVEEFKGIEDCKIEKDSSGRLINVTIPKKNSAGEIIYETFALTTETSTDQDAYKNAMNQYEYDKALYDQAVEKINSKIEIVQAEDKNLELRLKQLDTEQKAISNEKEAVQKVIENNTQNTFKTFNA